MKHRLATALCAAATVAALVVPASAIAAPPTSAAVTTQQIDPATLGRGAPPRVEFLVGRVLHPATGAPIHLPRTWRLHGTASYLPDLLTLVGHAGNAWYVQRMDKDYYGGWLYRVTRSGVKRISTGSDAGSGVLGWYLTSDRRRIVQHQTDGYGACSLRVLSLAGTVIARHGCAYDANFIGATATRVWYTTYEPTQTRLWSIADSTATSLGVNGALADPQHDLLFLRPSSTSPGGPTGLSSPGDPTWTAKFRAVAVSPDGTYVAGFGSQAIQIRRASDGSVVRQLSVGGNNGLQWESDTRLLISVAGRKDWVVRCPLTGACHTAAGPSPERFELDQVPTWHAEAMN